jgi:hypothetical protein
MIISEKQLLVLIKILEKSSHFYGGFADISHDDLCDFYSEIINQQSEKLKEVQ